MTSQPRQLAHTAVTVATTSGVALAASDNRTYVLLENDSSEPIYIKFGALAVLNEGIRINAGGGSYECSPLHGNLDNRAINAICASGSKVLLVTDA